MKASILLMSIVFMFFVPLIGISNAGMVFNVTDSSEPGFSNASGIIYELPSRTGISNLTVKITPPKSIDYPQKITRTSNDGSFDFFDIPKGKYLLQIYRGTILLYQNVVDTTFETSFSIILQRKNRS